MPLVCSNNLITSLEIYSELRRLNQVKVHVYDMLFIYMYNNVCDHKYK
jgi:hypothetical protein